MQAPVIIFRPGMTYQELENLVFLISHEAELDSLISLNINTVITLEYNDKKALESFLDDINFIGHERDIDYNGMIVALFGGRRLLLKYTGISPEKTIGPLVSFPKYEEFDKKKWTEELQKAPIQFVETKDKPKFFILYDINMIPPGADFSNIIDLFMTKGILLYNGDEGIPAVYDISEGKAEIIEIRNTVE